MNVKKKKPEDLRKYAVVLSLTSKEKMELQQRADEMGITLSSFGRMVLKDFMKKGRE